jgi:hypothetical protein
MLIAMMGMWQHGCKKADPCSRRCRSMSSSGVFQHAQEIQDLDYVKVFIAGFTGGLLTAKMAALGRRWFR